MVSKIYVATDSAPMDMFSYELCSEMIDVVIDVSCIYGCAPGPPRPGSAQPGRRQRRLAVLARQLG